MPRPADESRLEQSKMSFGEHLEELRKAIFKSIAALFIGFLFGLYFGNDIVSYIQTPLKASLERFYLDQAEKKALARLEALQSQGKAEPNAHIATADELAAAGLMPHEYLIAKEDFAALVISAFPELKGKIGDPDGGENLDAVPEGASPQETAAAKAEVEAALADGSQKLDRENMLRLLLYQPIEEDARLRVVGFNTTEPFSIYIRASLIAGVVFASPFIFYFIWEFVAAGLYRQEQSYVFTYLPMSLALFIGGATLAFYYAFEPLLEFMFWYFDRMDIQPNLRLSEWISLVMLMPLGFGVSFQLPLIMLMLERIGIFSVETYWSKWKAAIVVIAIAAMLLTPSSDPTSMLLMGVPLVGLYFGGIWLCKVMPGANREKSGYGSTGS